MSAGQAIALLNRNAGGFSASVERSARRAFGTVHVTRSLEELDALLAELRATRPPLLIAGGGDGTLLAIVRHIVRWEVAPAVGLLPLGTGNAIAGWAGTAGLRRTLARWTSASGWQARFLRLLDVVGEPSPFGGFGWDAAIVNDYHELKRRYAHWPLWRALPPAGLYVGAVVSRTAPRMQGRTVGRLRVTLRDGPGLRLDVRGQPIGDEVKEGHLLYEGPANICAFGTTPFYGRAFRMFPHAERERARFQLRVGAMGPWTAVNHIPDLWRGTFRHDRLYDFVVRGLDLEFDDEVDFQVGGDARGCQRAARVALHHQEVMIAVPD
jgi:diacylglycerol kinase family enzyme